MGFQTDPMNWAETLFGECELSDARLTRRLVHTMAQLARQGGGTISRACAGDAAALQGGYRLLRNSHLSTRAMNEAGFASAAQRIEPGHRILAIEDSSELSYLHSVADELGDTGVGSSSACRGLWAHNTLMVDAEDGLTLGLIAQTLWSRDLAQRGKKGARRDKHTEEKESAKWSRHAQQMRERLGPRMHQLITVSDRESDVKRCRDRDKSYRERETQRDRQTKNQRNRYNEPPLLFSSPRLILLISFSFSSGWFSYLHARCASENSAA